LPGQGKEEWKDRALYRHHELPRRREKEKEKGHTCPALAFQVDIKGTIRKKGKGSRSSTYNSGREKGEKG